MLDCPEERANPPSVARQKQAALLYVPESDRELPAKALEHRFPELLPKVGQKLGIGAGAKNVALGLEFLALFGIVEEFAVEDDVNGAVFVGEGLAAVFQADDAQTPV